MFASCSAKISYRENFRVYGTNSIHMYLHIHSHIIEYIQILTVSHIYTNIPRVCNYICKFTDIKYYYKGFMEVRHCHCNITHACAHCCCHIKCYLVAQAKTIHLHPVVWPKVVHYNFIVFCVGGSKTRTTLYLP